MSAVKIMILKETLPTSLGVFHRGAIIEIEDSVKLQLSALAGEIEYCNPAQTGLFDD